MPDKPDLCPISHAQAVLRVICQPYRSSSASSADSPCDWWYALSGPIQVESVLGLKIEDPWETSSRDLQSPIRRPIQLESSRLCFKCIRPNIPAADSLGS